jgi:hypothetical protein
MEIALAAAPIQSAESNRLFMRASSLKGKALWHFAK